MMRWLLLLITIINYRSVYGMPSIEVRYTKGSIETWNWYRPVWQSVKAGEQLPMGSLLRIHPESGIQFVWDGGEKKLQITTPMTLRLTDEILREVKANELMLSRLPNKWKSNGDPVTLTFFEAWQRTKLRLASFASFSVDKKLSIPTLKKPDFQVKRPGSQVLNVIQPAKNHSYHPDSLPHQIRLQWQPTERKKDAYHIYIWREAIRPNQPLATVKGSYYFATINSWGGHFLQIISESGFESEVITFHAYRGKFINPDSIAYEHKFSDYITIKSPAAHMEYQLRSEDNFLQGFHWDYKKPIKAGYNVTLTIKDALSGDIKTYQTRNKKVITSLSPDRSYIWNLDLQIKGENGDIKVLHGPSHLLNFQEHLKTSFGDIFSNAIDALPLQTKSNQLIYFED